MRSFRQNLYTFFHCKLPECVPKPWEKMGIKPHKEINKYHPGNEEEKKPPDPWLGCGWV